MRLPRWARWSFGLLGFAAATAGTVWVSGFLFFVFSKASPFGKTDWLTWWTYWQYYSDDKVIAKRLTLSAVVAAGACYGVLVALVVNAMRELRSLHGEARFATTGEIAQAGLFGPSGIIVGKLRERFLLFGGMQFVLLAAPTRSGKGVGIVVPNLLSFSDSCVVLDVKLENFLITSKYRAKHGQAVYLFNPFAADGMTHRHNPLGYISDDPRLRVAEIVAIGYMIWPGVGKDPFFDDAARNLFLGLCLYLCETPGLPRTMGEMLRQSSGKGQPIKTYLQSIINARNFREFDDVILQAAPAKLRPAIVAVLADILGVDEDEAESALETLPVKIKENIPRAEADVLVKRLSEAGAKIELEGRLVPLAVWDGLGDPPLSMECVDALNRFTNTSDNTLSSILASFNSPLTLWVSPLVDAATSANDFDVRDVRRKRMTIYVGIPANKLAEAELLMNIFFSQLVTLNTDKVLGSEPDLKYQCLMLMDEFAAPGRIGIIDKSNAFMAGYGLRLLTVIQSPSQIEAEPRRGYGREGAGTLITNHALQILFTPRKQSDANEYSEMLGYYTFKALGRSRSRGGRGGGGTTDSESDQRRALMMPQELKELSQRKQIINAENTKPILCDKIAYYSDHVFLDRLKMVSPSLAALDYTMSRRLLRFFGVHTKAAPSKHFLESVWGRGETAVAIPRIDLDLHVAVIQQRTRPVTSADIEAGIDLRKLALDMSKIVIPASDQGLAPDEVAGFVDSFFDALDAASGDEFEGDDVASDGSSEPPSDEELAALSEEHDDSEDVASVALVSVRTAVPVVVSPATAAVDADTTPTIDDELLGHDQEAHQLSDEELSEAMEAFESSDDTQPLEVSSLDEDADVPTYRGAEPALDLSVLDSPLKRSQHGR